MTLTHDLAYMRKMATAQHLPECLSLGPPSRPVWEPDWIDEGTPRGLHLAGFTSPPPPCPGCVTDADRALWRRLADELAAHLDQTLAEDLFGDMTTEPAATEEIEHG